MNLSGGTFASAPPTQSRKRGGFFQPYWLTFLPPVEAAPLVTAATNEVAWYDRFYHETNTASLKDTIWEFFSEIERPQQPPSIVRTSSNTAIIEPHATDPFRWTAKAVGTATLTVTTPNQVVSTAVTSGSMGFGREFSRFANDSLAKHCSDWVDAKIANKSAENATASLPQFSIYEPQNNTFVRNEALWTNPLDVSCMVAWNSYGYGGEGGGARAGIAITPRHVVMVSHFYMPVGTVLKFVTMNNVVVERTITHLRFPPGAYDTILAYLNADLPAGVVPAKILPTNWLSKMSVPGLGPIVLQGGEPIFARTEINDYPYPLPVIYSDQWRRLKINDLSRMNNHNNRTEVAASAIWSSVEMRAAPGPLSAQRKLFYTGEGVSGDSGSPVVMVVNDTVVLLCCMTGGRGGELVSDLGRNVETLAQACSALTAASSSGAPDYQPVEVELSGFAAYEIPPSQVE